MNWLKNEQLRGIPIRTPLIGHRYVEPWRQEFRTNKRAHIQPAGILLLATFVILKRFSESFTFSFSYEHIQREGMCLLTLNLVELRIGLSNPCVIPTPQVNTENPQHCWSPRGISRIEPVHTRQMNGSEQIRLLYSPSHESRPWVRVPGEHITGTIQWLLNNENKIKKERSKDKNCSSSSITVL